MQYLVGAHTYSRGLDRYPSNMPDLMVRGKGCRSWSADGREFVDTVMALACHIGFAEDEIDEAAIEQIRRGNTTSRPSEVELEAAEKLIDLRTADGQIHEEWFNRRDSSGEIGESPYRKKSLLVVASTRFSRMTTGSLIYSHQEGRS